MTAVAVGLLGGLATIAVSEFLLKFWGSGSAEGFSQAVPSNPAAFTRKVHWWNFLWNSER